MTINRFIVVFKDNVTSDDITKYVNELTEAGMCLRRVQVPLLYGLIQVELSRNAMIQGLEYSMYAYTPMFSSVLALTTLSQGFAATIPENFLLSLQSLQGSIVESIGEHP